MHLTSKKFKNLIPLTLLFPVLYVVLASSDLLIFHTNDDPAVIAIMKGTLAEPDYHVKPVHSILGYVFMCLYSWKPDFFWYDLFMVFFYCLGITRILIIFSVHNRLYFPISLLLLTSILVGFLPFQPNFTFLSFLLTFAAIFPFIVNDKKEFLGFTNRNVFFSFLMLFIACLYRDLSAFIMTGCAFLVYMSLAVSEHKNKKSTEIFLKIFSKRAFILIGMVGFTLFMHFVNLYSHRIIPEYDRYVEYDKYRSGIADFNNYRYNKTFEELGISLNDYYLMRNFWGIDAPPLHLENLRRLKPVVIYEYWRIRNGLMTTIHTMKYKSSLIILSILVLISFYFYQTWIISGVCLASIVAVATYTSRMGLRVFLPIMALALITSIFFHGSDLLKGGQPKRILVYFCCVLIFFSAIVWTRHVQYFLINLRVDRLKGDEVIWSFCKNENIKILAYWAGIPGNNRHLFKSGVHWDKIQVNLIGGWPGSLPQVLMRLRKTYGEDIYSGLAQADTYHLLAKQYKDIFVAFVKEHGPGNIQPNILIETKYAVLIHLKVKS